MWSKLKQYNESLYELTYTSSDMLGRIETINMAPLFELPVLLEGYQDPTRGVFLPCPDTPR